MRLVRFQRPSPTGWNALDRLSTLRDEITRLFEAPLGDGDSEVFNTWAPALDLYEDKDNLILRAELPGLKKEEIDISLHEGAVTISGERKSEKKYEGSETSREERFFGRFQRTLTLPKAVDSGKITASYKDGILTVTLPRAEEAKPRQITINAS